MAVDIVIPDGDEEEFLEIAEKLGYDQLIFLYRKQPSEKKGKTAYLAEMQNLVGKNKNKFDYVMAEADKWSFQDKRIDLLFNLEKSEREDFIHHRASGMNQVLAKQAADNDTKIAFNFSQLYDNDKDVILGRMMQNVNLCRKYKVQMALASFAVDPYEMRSPKDLKAFGETIGMHPKEAKQALDWK